MIEELLTAHEYQDWDTNDGLLYPVESSPTVCKCGATPGLPPPGGDWQWWVAHVAPILRAEAAT